MSLVNDPNTMINEAVVNTEDHVENDHVENDHVENDHVENDHVEETTEKNEKQKKEKKEKKEKKKKKKEKKKKKKDGDSSSDDEKQKKPFFVIKKWNACAMWSWDVCTDTCAICRNKLTEPSIEFQATGNDAATGIHISWGECTHVFHSDCIQRWCKTRHTCPLCNKDWKISKVESLDVTADTSE